MDYETREKIRAEWEAIAAACPMPDVEFSAEDFAAALGTRWPRPIPVSERLPENKDNSWNPVFAYFPGEGWVLANYYRDDGWWAERRDEFESIEPTHWLPLPPDPATYSTNH